MISVVFGKDKFRRSSMKKISCEMCGGTDLIKQDGVFVCQNCGLKYSVEEVKKMMIEGTVEVQGTVKVDNSDYVEKSLQNARRAYAKQDWEEAEKYYNLVEQYQPDNIEAIFYSAYSKALNTLIDAYFYKRESAFTVLKNSISIIDENYDSTERAIVKRIGSDLRSLYSKNFVYEQRKNGYGIVISDDHIKTKLLFDMVCEEFIQSCINIAEKHPANDVENRVYFYSIALDTTRSDGYKDYLNRKIEAAKNGVADSNQCSVYIENKVGGVPFYLSILNVFERSLIEYGTYKIDLSPGHMSLIYIIHGIRMLRLKVLLKFKEK